MILMDGKKISQEMRKELAEKALSISKQINRKPFIAIIQVGNNPASNTYVKNKLKAAKECNIDTQHILLLENMVSIENLQQIIDELNRNKNVDGIIVQLPLPDNLPETYITNLITNTKDVDGFVFYNKGALFEGEECLTAATPKGIMTLLKKYDINLKGKHAVVIGRSNIVGKPLSMLLLQEDATVTICHSKTTNLSDITKQADILISAVGKPKFVTADMVKEGAVVIDVGINRDENNKLCGDVDFENVAKKASYITPVPGGVGPMTIISLLQNTLDACMKNNNL